MAVDTLPRAEATPSRTANVLMTTLAFEAIVDAVIAFHVRVGILPSPMMHATIRQKYRELVAGMLNRADRAALDQAVLGAAGVIAEEEWAAHGLSAMPMRGIKRAIEAFINRLQKSPVAGVGAFR